MNVLKLITVCSSILLSGCGSNAVSHSGALYNDHIREIDVMPMSGGKYQVYIRGNNYSNQSELRAQFKREVQAICNSAYEVVKMEAGEVKLSGYMKPTLEAVFRCE
jgi:hypothetical protein|tara:strand:- start:78 stop:395 length:318 start_codon:yes stop_codon:yes gene_type:complete